MITQCCVCRKVEHEGQWLDPIYDLLMNPDLFRFSHDYCPECHKIVIEKIDEYFEKTLDKE